MASRWAVERARELRVGASEPEVRLWGFLRTLRRTGHHFRRQAPFGGYVLDFVSYRDRLVVEVDGGQHGYDAQMARDRVRDAVLAREGFRTLRFLAGDVMGNLEGVSLVILEALDGGAGRPLPGPPP